MQDWFSTFGFLLIPALMLGYFLWRMIRFGGIKAGILGARIRRTDVIRRRGLLRSTPMHIHQLQGGEKKMVGMDFSVPVMLTGRVYLSLSEQEARELITLLEASLQAKQQR